MKNLIKKLVPGLILDPIIKRRSERYIENMLNEWSSKGKPFPVPHIVKQYCVNSFRERFQTDIFVETGTYKGDMIYAQCDNFKELYSVEVSPELFEKAKIRFADMKNITLICGDSGNELHKLVPKLKTRTLFFLDGHFSSGITSKGKLNTPVVEELAAIFDNNKDHVILVDDARCFNGESDYPTIEVVKEIVKKYDQNYCVEVEDDIIRIFKP
ncbi:MAG: hypothetical protein ACK5D5_13475 [Bacteroidota bacterium]|jgi:tRNA G46 methylase TrmB